MGEPELKLKDYDYEYVTTNIERFSEDLISDRRFSISDASVATDAPQYSMISQWNHRFPLSIHESALKKVREYWIL